MKPLSRGLYLLELKGNSLDEKENEVDAEFLAEVMEINEDIMEVANQPEKMKAFEETNAKRVEEYVREISDAFEKNNIPRAKVNLIKLKYFANIDDKIKQVLRTHM